MTVAVINIDFPGTSRVSADGNWHHLAATYDQIYIYEIVYVDGHLEAEWDCTY